MSKNTKHLAVDARRDRAVNHLELLTKLLSETVGNAPCNKEALNQYELLTFVEMLEDICAGFKEADRIEAKNAMSRAARILATRGPRLVTTEDDGSVQ